MKKVRFDLKNETKNIFNDKGARLMHSTNRINSCLHSKDELKKLKKHLVISLKEALWDGSIAKRLSASTHTFACRANTTDNDSAKNRQKHDNAKDITHNVSSHCYSLQKNSFAIDAQLEYGMSIINIYLDMFNSCVTEQV